MDEVEVVVAHRERATLRVGDTFLKVDADAERLAHEVAVMQAAPLPTPQVLWHEPPALALARLRGRPIARLGQPSTTGPAAWAAAGAALRTLHEAPTPPWSRAPLQDNTAGLDEECAWIVAEGVLPRAIVARNREIAEAALRPHEPVFAHGDLQVAHVFVEHDEVTGVLDWSEAGPGDRHRDLATLTLGHREHLDDVLAGYGRDVDLDVVRGWWSLRSLLAIRWLVEHGFDPAAPGCEVDVLRAQAAQ